MRYTPDRPAGEQLADIVGGRAKQAATAISVGSLVWTRLKWIDNKWKNHTKWEVVVNEDTDLYPALQRWLLDRLPTKKVRSVEAVVDRPKRASSSDKALPNVLPAFDGTMDSMVEIDGHKVKVEAYKEDMHSVTVDTFGDQQISFGKRVIKLSCRSDEGRAAVLRHLDSLIKQKEQGSSGKRCFVLGKWGDWNRRDYEHGRELSTVFLPGSIVDDVVDDLKLFLDSEQPYLRHGLPWHRGYLFYGQPGTGKTSLAKALANHFNLDLYALPLHDAKNDTGLGNVLASLSAPAVLLLEDVDVISAATSREEKDGISTAGLLNALDGVSTPHGLITIMTTNYPDKLDQALVRSGRIDYKVECPTMTSNDAKAMIEAVVEDTIPFAPRAGIIPADVMEVLKRNLNASTDQKVAEMQEHFGSASSVNQLRV